MTRPARQVPDEARYGVIVCPRCRHAKGVDRAARTTTCGRCHARLEVDGLRMFYVTGDTEALRAAVGVLEAKVAGGEAGLVAHDEVEAALRDRGIARAGSSPSPGASEEEVIQHAASLAAGVEAMPKKIGRILDALDAAFAAGFTLEHVERAFSAAGLPVARAEQEVRRGLVTDELYEPRPGRLKRF